MKLDEFELLCDKPLFIDGVGYIKKPKLYDIREIGYDTYEILCGYLSIDINKYLEISNLKETYDKLSEEDKKINSLFMLLMHNHEFREAYKLILSFFISEKVVFNEECGRFEFFDMEKIEKEHISISENRIKKLFNKIFKLKTDDIILEDETKVVITGVIDNENFDEVRECILKICNIKQANEVKEKVKYKNETARKWAEKMAKAEKDKQAKENENMDIGKMISKYCADNKSGINMLNVYSLTMYQFLNQFMQHNHIRQSDIQDMIYANTVSFSDLKEYDSQLWLK